MGRASLSDEIAAVRALCRTLGLGEVTPTLLKAAHHTSLLVAPLAMVARVQSSEPLDAAEARASRELAVVRHLAGRGAPVPTPLEARLAGPYVMASAVVTFWSYVAHERTADEADASHAAATLAAVHRALRDYDGGLPPFTHILDRCWRVLTDDSALAALSRQDRDLLKSDYRRLRHHVEAMAGPWVPLHGDVHLGNLLVSRGGPVWTDFEDASLGPVEHDIAGLPPAVWTQFDPADQSLIAQCADLKSVCVAVWCWADTARSPAVREAAAYHLARVRQRAHPGG